MATLQVRDIDDRLYRHLKTAARLQNRSLSQEVVAIIENYLSSSTSMQTNATAEFLSLTGAWEDGRDAEKIVLDLRASRNQTSRSGVADGIFD